MRISDWSSDVCSSDLHSGRNAFRTKLKELGFDGIGDNAFQEAFHRFKDLADKKKDIFDEDIVALVDDSMARESERIRFVSLGVMAGSIGAQTAQIVLEIDGEPRWTQTSGSGPGDAIFNAI